MRPHLPRHRLATATALACGALLTACGGGTDSPASATTANVASVSQSDATADAANATATGIDTATAMDAILDTTTALSSAQATGGLAHVESADRATQAAGVTDLTVDCAGGGTATLSITGGTPSSDLNGQLDAGEHYSVTYAQCSGGAGLAQLTGNVEMDVVAADHATSPTSVSIDVTVTHLSLALPAGTATLDGSATLARTVATSGDTTTTTSHVTVPDATLVTAFNGRSGSFTVSDLDATRTVTSVGGVVTASQYAGHHTLSGTANARSFTMTVATTGSVNLDASGAVVSGAWAVVRPLYTLATAVAGGVVVVTLDVGNDGAVDRTWTFPVASLAPAVG